MGRLILGSLLVALLAPTLGWAQGSAPPPAGDQRARVLYENGAILYEEGRYEDAIDAWKEAYGLSDRPLFLFNIANALERIGRWDEALVYLNKYRAFAEADERTVLERRMRNIEQRLDDARDRERESDEARRQDEADRQERVEADRVEEETARAEEEAAAAGLAPFEGPLIPGFVLISTGVGLLAVGGGLSGAAVIARTDAAALCKETGELLLCPHTATESLGQDASLSLGSDIAFAAGAATAATGLVLVIAHITGAPEATARVVPTAGPTGLGLGVWGRF